MRKGPKARMIDLMLPMLRSKVFVILWDIFHQYGFKEKTPLGNITMNESVGNPYDIDFRCEYTGIIVGYLRIVNPPEDCVDGEYCFVYHVPKTQEDSTIAIDSSGNIRVEGADIDSFIYRAIKDNANRLAEYAKMLTLTYQHQVGDTIVSIVKTYCETLMNEHASVFDQLDISVSEGCCDEITEFLIRSINEPDRNCQFDVVKYMINDNDIWVRFSKPDGWLWTPLVIKPSIGDTVINTEQCVFTDIFDAKEMARLARLISEQTGFAISVRDGGSTRDKNVAKYIKSFLQKHEVIDTVKQACTTAKVDNENNKTLKSIVDDLVDKKLDEFVKTGSMCFTTKDFLCSKICEQLALRQQEIFLMIYSAIYCTLAESKYTGAALALEKHFMRLVSTDKGNDVFHVYFKLDDIYRDLPRFDIEFNQYGVYIRIQGVDLEKPLMIINRNVRVYTQNIKCLKDTHKTIMSQVVSKIVLMEGLS